MEQLLKKFEAVDGFEVHVGEDVVDGDLHVVGRSYTVRSTDVGLLDVSGEYTNLYIERVVPYLNTVASALNKELVKFDAGLSKFDSKLEVLYVFASNIQVKPKGRVKYIECLVAEGFANICRKLVPDVDSMYIEQLKDMAYKCCLAEQFKLTQQYIENYSLEDDSCYIIRTLAWFNNKYSYIYKLYNTDGKHVCTYSTGRQNFKNIDEHFNKFIEVYSKDDLYNLQLHKVIEELTDEDRNAFVAGCDYYIDLDSYISSDDDGFDGDDFTFVESSDEDTLTCDDELEAPFGELFAGSLHWDADSIINNSKN